MRYPVLYSASEKDFRHNGLGILRDTIEAFVEEEANGLFELQLKYKVNGFLYNHLEEGNIIKADASDRLKGQLFRIHRTIKKHDSVIEVYANHISYDLKNDIVKNIEIKNQSCEYVLNEIFRQSDFSKHFTGYSDIQHDANYSMKLVDCLSAIAGTKGSIIDTFGNGAEILRDNFNIHILNRRGKDDNVLISYKKNLTGIEIEEDKSDLITRIYPFAKFTKSENGEENARSNEEITYTPTFGYVDSPKVNLYEHPYISLLDVSDKFDEGEEPTDAKFKAICEKYFENNKCDVPKINFKVQFVPLSLTENYKDKYKVLEDVGLMDRVIIRDARYDVDTEAKVIRTKYNVLKGMYDEVELGNVKTSLGDIIVGTQGSQGEKGEQGIQGEKGEDGEKFPDTLPDVPRLTVNSMFATIALTWSYESKVYYTYELYASQTKDFTPNESNLLFKGQASSFLHEVQSSQTWYYRARAVNTYGSSTAFSEQVTGSTFKLTDDNITTYIDELAIGNALIKELNVDKVNAGKLKGVYIDARELNVTDGNGKRTLQVDSFGNVYLDVAQLSVNSSSVVTNEGLITEIQKAQDALEDKIEKEFQDVNESINSAMKDLEDALTDSVLSEAEKAAIREHIKIIGREKDDVLYQVASLKATAELNNTQELIDLKVQETVYIQAYLDFVAKLELALGGM